MKTNINFLLYLAKFFFERNVSHNSCRENQNKYFPFNNLLFRQLCSLLDNMEKYCRAGRATYDNITQFMHFSCWINKAKKQHPEFLILIAFLLQVWLHERTLFVCDTYIACLVIKYISRRTL
jgi:hypothetical protein